MTPEKTANTASKRSSAGKFWMIMAAAALIIGGMTACNSKAKSNNGDDDDEDTPGRGRVNVYVGQSNRDVYDEPEPVREEIIEEELLESPANTYIEIVDDDDYPNYYTGMRNYDELEEDVPNDGIDDLTRSAVLEQVQVAEPSSNDESVYTVANVQQLPQFPGGDYEMYKWLSEHIQYPASAAEERVEGRVVVEFVVDKTGDITKVRVVRGKHPALDKEAVRVVSAMPRWSPGKNNGSPVKVSYNLPVTFKLTTE